MEAFTFDGDSGDEAKFDAAFGAECFSLADKPENEVGHCWQSMMKILVTCATNILVLGARASEDVIRSYLLICPTVLACASMAAFIGASCEVRHNCACKPHAKYATIALHWCIMRITPHAKYATRCP